MAKLLKQICFKVIPKLFEIELEKIEPSEMEETAHWKKCVEEMAYIGSSVPTEENDD